MSVQTGGLLLLIVFVNDLLSQAKKLSTSEEAEMLIVVKLILPSSEQTKCHFHFNKPAQTN